MKYIRYPNEEEWDGIINNSPFVGFDFSSSSFYNNNPEVIDILDSPIINSHGLLLIQRFRSLVESYILLTFYYQLGIPDETEKRNTNDTFKDFEPHHFGNKEKFDYYSDVFYFKVFSCWEVIGHILNIRYDLKMKKIEFKKVVRQLKRKDNDMFLKLFEIINNIDFIKANTYRNQITHNYSPNMPGLVRSIDENGMVIEYVQEYYSSRVVYDNIKSVLELLKRSIEVIKN
ncbi:Cthe_2314 family HEPN domain-containing protein [Paenibacillus sp. XY044]|uniref:Cthe_2314 family HEPN domain-containing protein n=1 Tax=Paenibacillus sp. XY044 TaxID=2026089 RepID=UPI000B985EE3|nr:Cthe_2314 family HEPN domain-containing protein [Paenibacillus sp. XY044]OZB94145.1 hypothetical protein CJP46_18200 [Paenibacillus sp. XY044]